MDIQELEAMLTEGLTEEQAKPVRDAVRREAVKAKAAGYKAQKEFDAIAARAADLQAQLDGDAASGKLGAKAYQEWYAKYGQAIEANDRAIQAFEAKHGAGSFQKAANGELPGQNPNPNPKAKTYTDEDIQRIVDSRFQAQFAPNIAGVVKGLGKVVQKHMLAGRKTEVDLDAVEKIMSEKGLTIDKAYEEWDKPEREKEIKAATDREVERRVNEELQKRGSGQYFPAGADSTPGTLSLHRDASKFDKGAMERELVQTYITGKYPGATESESKGAGFFGTPN